VRAQARWPLVFWFGLLGAVAVADQARESTLQAYVVVLAKDGITPVTNLTPSDFGVRVDGQSVRIRSVSAGPQPVSAVVLFDASASVGLQPARDKERIEAFESSFSVHLRETDRVRVGTFAGDIWLSPKLTGARADLAGQVRLAYSSLPAESRYGPSPLWDSIGKAIDALQADRGRHFVIAVTDGRSTGNVHSRSEIIRKAVTFDTALCFIVAPVIPDTGIPQAALESGGLWLSSHTPQPTIGLALGRILEAMHGTYLLTFEPQANLGDDHRIEIAVRGQPTVSYRRAYSSGAISAEEKKIQNLEIRRP